VNEWKMNSVERSIVQGGIDNLWGDKGAFQIMAMNYYFTSMRWFRFEFVNSSFGIQTSVVTAIKCW